jgi:CheY-like chemotaxis protein
MNKLQSVLKDLTFLVVDDEPDNVGVVVKLLTLMGAKVHSAEDGQGGLEAARRIHPDIILTDLSMPVMSGWQLLHEIRKDPAIRTTPVVALTAHAMAGDRERVLSAGFANYIAKPIDVPLFLPQLMNIVTEVGPKAPDMVEQPGSKATVEKVASSNGTKAREMNL